MSAPEFGEDGSCNCTEKDTKLKLHILLDDWPAVIDRTNNKDKTTDLEVIDLKRFRNSGGIYWSQSE